MASEGGKHFKPKGQPAPGPGGVQAPRPVSSRPVPPSPYARPTRGAQAADGQRPVQGVRPIQGASSVQGARPVHGAQADASASSAYRAPRGGESGRSGKRRGNVLSNILIAVGVALLLVAGGLFVKAQIGYKKANDYYNGIAEMAVKDSSGEDGIPQIDFDALKKESDDIVGWIYVPGTRINYVVAQGETNNTYLRHLPNGEYSENGTIFMDMDGTAPGMVNQQTTLYGHHMNDGAMFEPIDASMDQKVFDTFKKVYYITPEMTYVLKPMFTMQVQDDYVDARRTNFDSERAFTQYLQASLAQAKASAKDAAAEVEKADKVLTLVTCAGQIIPRTTRAGMVCRVVDTIPAQ
ncbi:class B sortase [Collinsella intestinalis]|uniref:class B sortase n=1 Tax=Collinsella intestinalis TaxID=147207 RepID=UPI0022DEDD90|nr:class B sortase [Collinsella intestinalis]